MFSGISLSDGNEQGVKVQPYIFDEMANLIFYSNLVSDKPCKYLQASVSIAGEPQQLKQLLREAITKIDELYPEITLQQPNADDVAAKDFETLRANRELKVS